MNVRTVVCVLLLSSFAGPARAQTSDSSAAPGRGFPGVYVIERSGQETRGKLISWTDAAIVLRVDDNTRTFSTADLLRVDLRGDSLKNGALIGAGVGIATGLLSGGLADCPGTGDSCAGSRVAFVLFGTAIYAAIGTAIDALMPGRTPLWSSSSKGSAGGLTFNVSPRNRSAVVGWRF